MDFGILFVLCAFISCNLACSAVSSQGSQRQAAGVLKISKGGGAIVVDDAPNGAELQTGGGKVYVKSARQFVEVNTGAGEIVIDAIDGSVQATTGAGNVSVTMVGNPSMGERDVAIASSSGDVTLVVPAGLDMNLDLKLAYTRTSKQFRIVSDFPLNQRETDQWSSDEGTPRKYIYGTGQIGSGRNQIKVHTVNGNIYLKRGQ
jgi:DUF4097 and DUF4098 domain-containing protein YvlB